jgi:acyl-coenzyme A synthetase/AMP-(fatty) acid ligase
VNVRELRAQLVADSGLGVGNVLTTLASLAGEATDPSITFDTDVDEHPAWQPMTLTQLERHAAARASWYHAHGVRPRDPVAVYVSTAAGHVLSYLALTRIGAIPALVNGGLDPEIARIYIGKIGPSALVTDAVTRRGLGADLPEVPLRVDVDATGSGDPDRAPRQYRYDPADAAVITHSSGTTGVPKPVIGAHSTLFASVRHRLRLPRQPRSIERMLSAFPTNHAAMVIVLNEALCTGAEIMALSRQDGTAVADAITGWKPSRVFGFAATWPQLLAQDLSRYDLDSVQLWWNTGDCAHEGHIRKLITYGHRMLPTAEGIKRTPGSSFIDGFGSSEMGHSQFFITHTARSNRYDRCIGRPHAFAEITVLDDDGEPLPAGQAGHLALRSSTLSPGYWNDSELTYRSRRNGYYLTGDLVRRDEAGYYYHLDRAADAVRLPGGGYLYTALSEERILAACADILDCTVVAVADESGNVTTDVLLTLARGADPAVDHTDAVLSALGPAVAATVRKVTLAGDTIPYGATGKVLKRRLRERTSAEPSA